MATKILIPSQINNAASSYLTISDQSNAYTDTSSTTYATVTNTNASTSNRYIYLKGFDFDSIPSGATVNSFTVKIKGYYTGGSQQTLYLCNGTTTQSGATATGFSTSSATRTFSNGSLTWSTISGWGDDFGIRINCRRGSRNTQATYYIYGAEIDVDYTAATQYSVTIQNSTSANVQASDTAPYEGADVEITTDTLSGLTITDNGVDVTSQFVQEQGGTISQTAGSYTTELSASGAAFYLNSSTTGNAFNYAVGHTAESPGYTSAQSTYVKDNGSNTATGWAIYDFDFSDVPINATISSMTVKCYGFTESTTHDSTHKANIRLYSGSTAKGSEQYFTSTSNQTITLSNTGTWTAAELHDAALRFEVAYYGGGIFGITWTVVYEVSGYIYTITAIAANHTIVVSSGGVTQTAYIKRNGSWTAVSAVYKKVSGSWVLQSNLASVFDSGTNYHLNS